MLEQTPASSISLFKRVFNILAKSIRGVYYLSIWFGIIILVLTLMAPFMKVAKPTNYNPTNEGQSASQSIRSSSKSSAKKQRKRKRKFVRKNSMFEIIDKDPDLILVNGNCNQDNEDDDQSIETSSTSSQSSTKSDNNLTRKSGHKQNKKKRDKSREMKLKKRQEVLVYKTLDGPAIQIGEQDKLASNFNQLSSTSSSNSSSIESLCSSSSFNNFSYNTSSSTNSSSRSSVTEIVTDRVRRPSNSKANRKVDKSISLYFQTFCRSILSFLSRPSNFSFIKCSASPTRSSLSNPKRKKPDRIAISSSRRDGDSFAGLKNMIHFCVNNNTCFVFNKTNQALLITSFSALIISLAATYALMNAT